MAELSRSEFLKLTGAGLVGLSLPSASMGQEAVPAAAQAGVTEDQIKTALKLANLSFADEEVKEMVGSVTDFGKWWPPLREVTIEAGFMGMNWRTVDPILMSQKISHEERKGAVELPKSEEDIAFMSVIDLSKLIKAKKITSVRLTQIYLARLKKYGPKLRCLVTLTEDRALKQAAKADQLLKEGRYLGLLHGIPFGVKDLFEAAGYPTSWGIRTRKDTVSTHDSDVVRILEEVGAVLVAKLSLGALAMGDVWYEGRTESPWNNQIGSSGSSAGSASAVAAGLVPFAIGTETNGSLISPAHNCRVTTLRPTFGSVSRAGAMALCWSLDKVGPICRSAEDCAAVMWGIVPKQSGDPGQIRRNWDYKQVRDLRKLSWGYLVNRPEDGGAPESTENRPWLKVLRDEGIEPKAVFLPPFPEGMYAILFAECAAAFESFTRSADIQDLEGYSSWPESFRSGRLIPAVEYIQADRLRPMLLDQYLSAMADIDIVVADDRLYSRIFGLNATGIPQMSIPMGVDERNRPRSFSMICKPLCEEKMVAAAQLLQEKLGFLRLRPDMRIWE
jgi:Asp-tRNA(Asn)/Glu-tRNA(Gln) amidotransferase A subunit family amidase